MIERVKVTISLPPRHAAALRKLAAARYDGNASAVVREALETSPATSVAFKGNK